MFEPFTVIMLICGIVTAVVLTEVLILAIPLAITFSFHSDKTETKGFLKGSWGIFGLGILVSGKGAEVSVMVGRTRLITRPLPSIKDPGKKHDTGPVTGQIPHLISSLVTHQGPVLGLVLDLVRHTRLDYARGFARIGLGDPCATGMLYGLYRAIIPLLPVQRTNLTMVPEFNHEVCDLDITSRFHITYPILFLVNAVKVVKHPAAREVMNIMRTKTGDVAA